MDKQDKKQDKKPAPQKAGPHDRFFKRLFSHPQTAPEFLKLILPKEDLLRLDLNRVHLEKDTFPDGKTADLLISAPVKGAPANSPRFHVLAEHKAEKIGRPAVRQLGGYQDDFIDGYWKERRRIPDILSVFAYQGKEPFAPPGGLKPAGARLAAGAGPLAAPIAGFQESLGEDFFAKNPLTVRRFMIDFKMPVLDFIRGERVLEALKEGSFLCYPGLVLLHSIHERPADAEFIGYVFSEFNDFFRENEDLLLGAYNYLLDGYRADPAVLKAAEEKAVRDGILPGGGVMDVREEIKEEGRQEERRDVILNMIQKKFDISVISEATGLPEAEIVKYKNGELKNGQAE